MHKQSLAGRSVIVTQPAPACDAFCQGLREQGMVPLLLPSYHIQHLPLTQADTEAVASADYVIITSRHVFTTHMTLPNRPYLVMGPTTEATAHRHGFSDTQQPDHPSSEGMLALLDNTPMTGKSIRILTGENPRPMLADTLRSRGAQVDYLYCYRRTPAAYTQDTITHLASENPLAISIHSGDGLRYLANTLSQQKDSPLWAAPLLLVSDRYRALAHSLGFSGNSFVADNSSPPALITALLNRH